MTPKFSIVVPAYNAQRTLPETLDAIASQDFSNWECLVVDDGSVDKTLEIAQSYAENDKRFTVLSQRNKGTGGAYNTGVRAAVAPFVCICSADDLLTPAHLSSLDAYMDENPDFEIYSTNGKFLLDSGATPPIYTEEMYQKPLSFSLATLAKHCFYSVGAVYRRSFFEKVGGYNEDAFGEDYEFWLKIMLSGARHIYSPQNTTYFRVSATQKSANYIQAFKSDINILQSTLDANVLRLSKSDQRAFRRAIRRRRLQILRTRFVPPKVIGVYRAAKERLKGFSARDKA